MIKCGGFRRWMISTAAAAAAAGFELATALRVDEVVRYERGCSGERGGGGGRRLHGRALQHGQRRTRRLDSRDVFLREGGRGDGVSERGHVLRCRRHPVVGAAGVARRRAARAARSAGGPRPRERPGQPARAGAALRHHGGAARDVLPGPRRVVPVLREDLDAAGGEAHPVPRGEDQHAVLRRQEEELHRQGAPGDAAGDGDRRQAADGVRRHRCRA
mmetsp:Transcript_35148/g.86207  ORF Transcript_35148/g.86207 Transcript_35148/m.86207 type:complete len:217 (+) Transcript_35148:1172-1822(+)